MARDLSSDDLLKQQKARAQRVDHLYYNKPHPWRTRMLVLSIIAPILGGAVLMLFVFLPSGAAIYTPGPVSTKHAMFANKCESCHESGYGKWGAVPDSKCQNCHEGPLHNTRQVFPGGNILNVEISVPQADGKFEKKKVDVGDPHCASCHAEHIGSPRLADITDGHCTQCHLDLKVSDGQPLKFRSNISNFDNQGHPDWAALKQPDSTQLKFNHAAHMKTSTKKSDGSALNCADCHRPDKQRAYMLPISYNAHCATCHPIAIPPIANIGDVLLPHGQPTLATAVVKAAISEYLIKNGGKLPLKRTKNPEYKDPKPGRPKPKGIPEFIEESDPRTPEQWRKESVEAVLEPLFFPSAPKDGTCFYCHVSNVKDEATSLPRIIDPKIPSIWLTHSRFNHEMHRDLFCESCHTQARTSAKTEDVLLPGIQNCQNCHKASGGARSGCNECHVYHDKTHPQFNGKLSIEDLLNGQFSRVEPITKLPTDAQVVPALPAPIVPPEK